MKSGITLQEMAAELDRQNRSKRDFIADTRKLRFKVANDDTVRLDMIGVGADFGVRDRAHRQFGGTLGIPADYYDKMRADSPDLLVRNLNHWMERTPSNRLLRTIDGDCRALLSDRYRPLDNYDLATAILPTFAKHAIVVKSCNVSENHMQIKAVLPELRAEIGMPAGAEWGKGHDMVDVVQGGLIVSNSEVGAGRLLLRGGLHTVECTNLATFKRDEFGRTHLGPENDSESFLAKYATPETKALTDQAMWAQVQDYTIAALDGRIFNEIVAEVRATRENGIEKDHVKEVVEVVGAQFDLRENEKDSVLAHLIGGGDLSQYGVHAAITRMSSDVADYDRASDLERMGGQVIELSRDQWTTVTRTAAREAEKKTAL